MLNLGENLYNKLPAFYKSFDSKIEPNPYPLKRFLQVLGGGFDYLEGKIVELGDTLDIDACPPEYLRLVGHLLGIEFPYAMDVDTQRKYLKVMPNLYRLKGTHDSFEYLARETFGSSAVISTFKTQYVEGMPPEEWRKFHIRIELDGETLYLVNKEDNFRKFAELLRPANTILITDLALFYMDKYVIRPNAEYKVDIIHGLDTDDYNKSLLVDTYLHEIMTSNYDDDYLKVVSEEILDSTITADDESFDRTTDAYDSVHIPSIITDETYTKHTTSEGTTQFITVANGISNLVGATTLTTSFKLTNYTPLNYTLSH